MRLDQLYPEWHYLHQRLLQTLEHATEAQIDYRPMPTADSIADMVLHMIREERWWVGVVIAGYDEYRPVEKEHRTTGALIEAIRVTREITERVLFPFSAEGLRAVRTVPADPGLNRPETNMPISRLVWQVLENEVTAYGRISLRLEDAKLSAPPRDPRRN